MTADGRGIDAHRDGGEHGAARLPGGGGAVARASGAAGVGGAPARLLPGVLDQCLQLPGRVHVDINVCNSLVFVHARIRARATCVQGPQHYHAFFPGGQVVKINCAGIAFTLHGWP